MALTYEQAKDIMYGRKGEKVAATPSAPATSAAAPISGREAAGKNIYNLSLKPYEEQKHIQAARAAFAGSIANARYRNDRAKVLDLEKICDQSAAATYELGLNDAQTKQCLSGIAHNIKSPKSRDELTVADDAFLVAKHGADKPTLIKLAGERLKAVLAGKPELHTALANSNAPAHRDVVEPVLEALAASLVKPAEAKQS